MPPPAGEFWICGRCLLRYDTFAHRSVCPRCGTRPQKTMCPSCAQSYPFVDWYATVLPADEGPDDEAAPAVPFSRLGPAPDFVPPPPAAPAPPKGPSVTLGQRFVWGALFAALAFVPAMLLGGPENWATTLALAAGGALFGAPG